jgi:hypothetical protein
MTCQSFFIFHFEFTLYLFLLTSTIFLKIANFLTISKVSYVFSPTQVKTYLNIMQNMDTMPAKCILDLCRVFDSRGRKIGRLEAVFFDKTYSQISLEQFRYFFPKRQTFEIEYGIILQSDESGFVGHLYQEMNDSDNPLSHTHREMTLLDQRYKTEEDAQKQINHWDISGLTSFDACYLQGEKKYAVVLSDMYPNLTKGSSFLRVVWHGDNDMQRRDTIFFAPIVSNYVSHKPCEYINKQVQL